MSASALMYEHDLMASGASTVPEASLPPPELVPPAESDSLLEKYLEFAPTHQALLDRTAQDRVKDASLNIAAAGLTLADSPGGFETAWVGITMAAAQTHSPVLAAALTTAAVGALEVGGAWGSSRLLAREAGSRAMSWLHKGLGRLGLKKQVETGPITDLATTFAFGVPAMTASKQALDPSRSERTNRKHGIRTGLIATALGAPVNYAVAEGFISATPEKIGVAALAVAGLMTAKKLIANRLRGGERPPRYHLSEAKFTSLQGELVNRVKREHGETVCSVIMDSGSKFADLVRTLEVQPERWPELEEIMRPYEGRSQFIALVDTRGGEDRIVHAFRLSNAAPNKTGTPKGDNSLKIALLQDMVDSGQISEAELKAYYEKQGVDLDRSISVESNFVVGERVPRVNNLGTADLGYLTLFHMLSKLSQESKIIVFAHLNRVAKFSLGRSGVEYQPLAGREDLGTPTTGNKTDKNFKPYAIPLSGQNLPVFRALEAVAPPTLYL